MAGEQASRQTGKQAGRQVDRRAKQVRKCIVEMSLVFLSTCSGPRGLVDRVTVLAARGGGRQTSKITLNNVTEKSVTL